MLNKITATLALLLFVLMALPSSYAQSLTMRISHDSPPGHVRTVTLQTFIKQVEERSNGQITVKVYGNGQLFRDRDVLKALRQGGIEMGLPGYWFVGGLVPEAAIPMLPAFFGLPPEKAGKLLDGSLSQTVNDRLEKKGKVKTLGRWFTFGPAQIYSVEKPIKSHADLKGMKIRAPGGTPNVARIIAFGASPVKITFTDLPLALSQGSLDAFISANESIVSKKLWDTGIRYSLQDNEFTAAYIPMVSQTFWKKLTPDLQKMLVDTWDENVDAMREAAKIADQEALSVLKTKGIEIAVPTQDQIKAVRNDLLKTQPELVKKMQIDQTVIDQVVSELRELEK
jgi:TRAP-type C4-dicarboxylate transport system, periplasmic component